MSERLWLLHDAITSLNDDTQALRDAVRNYREYAAMGDVAAVAADKLARHVLWPALFDKVCASALIARGRRDGASGPQDIPAVFFIRSKPDFEADSFRNAAGTLFEDVHFVRSEPAPAGATEPVKKGKPGPKGAVTNRVVTQMLEHLRSGQTTPDGLRAAKQVELEAIYRASAHTVRKARLRGLSEFSAIPNSA